MPAAIPGGGDTTQRDEGNAAHWLAEQMFNGAQVGAGSVAPNGYVVTDDMVEHVSNYVSALDCGEMEVDTSYSGASWEVRGRADHLSWRSQWDGQIRPGNVCNAQSLLTIDDFKYGWRPVSPVRNFTLMSHAIGWIIRTQQRPDRITFRIHQPRPYHPDGPLREWSCSFEELMGYYSQIDARLSNPTDELVTGLDQCAKCHALAICPAARTASMNAIDAADVVFTDDLPKPVLTAQMETLRQAVTMIEARRDAIEELITHRIKSGEVFDGYLLERSYGQRRWKPGLGGAALSALAGVDLRKDGLVTPAEAERRGVSKAAVAALTDRPLLDPKLKAVDVDARARSVFGEGG
jgi:hypothetical protein